MSGPFEENKFVFQEIVHPEFKKKNIRLTIARLDMLHPVVSGNKLFKLHYFLKEAKASHKKLLTFGGAYSNHLVATAYAAKEIGTNSIGIIRGEKPLLLSHTLKMCIEFGMQLEFISRSEYKKIHEPCFLEYVANNHKDCVIIPEGGFHTLGAKGASLIMNKLLIKDPTHICVPVGTATTLAGLLLGSKEQLVIGFPAVKNMTDIESRINTLLGEREHNNLRIIYGYHFGGYAKATNDLIIFMNKFYEEYKVPLDFVYTAKMMYGLWEKINLKYFPAGSNIICLHTGGLQGNKSLQKGLLVY